MKITIDEIKENMAFAANIMRRLPAVKVQGYLCAWPKFCYDADDFPSSENVWMMPLPEEVELMEEILEWLKWISVEKRRIVWLRACGLGWKRLCDRMHKPRSSLARDYQKALNEIQNELKTMPEIKNRYFTENLSHQGIEKIFETI